MASDAGAEGPTPLQGLVVADFSRVLAGPLAAMVLGDLGADVIKVEKPGSGDDTRVWGPPWLGSESTYSLAMNRNKRSVTLDLADPSDAELARKLGQRADVLVENFRPGTPERFGLDYQTLKHLNPGLVYASVTGFGTSPQAHNLGGYDFVTQAVSGLMSITGEPDGSPQKVGVAVVDVLTGLYVAIGVLSALAERERSGEGQKVHVSLLSAGLASLVNQASAYIAGNVVPKRGGNSHPSIAPYDLLATADRPIVVAAGSDRLFSLLAEVVGRPNLATDPRFATNSDRVNNRTTLCDELEQALVQQPAATWISAMRRAGIPVGGVNDISEAFAEAKSLGIDPIVLVRRDDGTVIPTVRSPIELSRTPPVARSAPPLLGEHNGDVRRWLESLPFARSRYP